MNATADRQPKGAQAMETLPDESILFIRRTKDNNGYWLAYYFIGNSRFWVDRKTKKALVSFAEWAGLAVRVVD